MQFVVHVFISSANSKEDDPRLKSRNLSRHRRRPR